MPRAVSAFHLVAWFKQRSPGACRLAESVSLAVRVDPGLLRRARLELNPGVGVGAEADLWFSPLIESASASGLVLRVDVAAVLRERLKSDPKRLKASWALLKEFHPYKPHVVVLEEQVTYEALRGGEEARREINRLLGRVVRTLLTRTERAQGLARWAQRALPRMPLPARESEAGAALALGAVVPGIGPKAPLHGTLPIQFPRALPRVLPAGTGRTRLRLYRERDSLVFLDPDGEVPGHDLDVPATTPIILDLAWREGEEERQRLVFPEPGVREPLPESVEVLRIRAMDGREWDFVTDLGKRRPPVFISFSPTSQAKAEALRLALGEELAFMGAAELKVGDRFPSVLADTLLASRVFIAFVDETYFRRWYCLWELEAALGSYLALAPEAALSEKEEALSHVCLVVPALGDLSLSLAHLPQQTSWSKDHDIRQLARQVRQRLATNSRRLEERLGARGAAVRERLLSENSLPPPVSLASVRHYPRKLPPSLGESFVGRLDDLWRIQYVFTFQKTTGRPQILSLEGIGGIGKTQLALEFVHRFGSRSFPGGVFWVNAASTEDWLEEQLHGVLRTLRPDVPELSTFRRQGRQVERHLREVLSEEAARKPILYVVDDIPEPGPDEAPKPLKTWCPAVGRVTLLLISRARIAPEWTWGAHGIEGLAIEPLSSPSAVALLRSGVTQVLPEESWRQIANWVGNLPLALKLLNYSLQAEGIGVQELLQLSEGQKPTEALDRQSDVLLPYVPSGVLRRVSEAFRISYEKLSEPAQRAAETLAWLSPAPLPLRLVELLGPELRDASVRFMLKARSFVTPVEEGSVPMFGLMHRVLADFLRNRSTDPVLYLERACQALLEIMTPEAGRDPKAWPLLNTCLPHGEQVFQRILDLRELFQPSLFEKGLELANRVLMFLSARGLLKSARVLASTATQRASKVLGLEHPQTRSIMLRLAEVFQAMGDYPDARDLLERVVDLNLRTLGWEDPNTLVAMNALVMTLSAQGELERARTYGYKALDASKRVLGEEHPYTLSAMSNLAEILRARGDLMAAQKLQEKVLEDRRRIQGEEHPDTLREMNNLSMALYQQGYLQGARELDERALVILRRVLGESHPDTLVVMNNLAITLAAQGDIASARAYGERVLEISRRVLGENHPATLRAMNNLAVTLSKQGDLGDARALQERVLEISRRTLGEEHPTTLRARQLLDQFSS